MLKRSTMRSRFTTLALGLLVCALALPVAQPAFARDLRDPAATDDRTDKRDGSDEEGTEAREEAVCSLVPYETVFSPSTWPVSTLNYDHILDDIVVAVDSLAVFDAAFIETALESQIGPFFVADSITFSNTQLDIDFELSTAMDNYPEWGDYGMVAVSLQGPIHVEGTVYPFPFLPFPFLIEFDLQVRVDLPVYLFPNGTFSFEDRGGVYLGSGADFYGPSQYIGGLSGGMSPNLRFDRDVFIASIVTTQLNGQPLIPDTQSSVDDFVDTHFAVMDTTIPLADEGISESDLWALLDTTADVIGILRTREAAYNLYRRGSLTNLLNLEAIWMSFDSQDWGKIELMPEFHPTFGTFICDFGPTASPQNNPLYLTSDPTYTPFPGRFVMDGVFY